MPSCCGLYGQEGLTATDRWTRLRVTQDMCIQVGTESHGRNAGPGAYRDMGLAQHLEHSVAAAVRQVPPHHVSAGTIGWAYPYLQHPTRPLSPTTGWHGSRMPVCFCHLPYKMLWDHVCEGLPVSTGPGKGSPGAMALPELLASMWQGGSSQDFQKTFPEYGCSETPKPPLML